MKVPNFKDPEITKFLVDFMRDQDKREKDFLKSNTANKSVLLYSPSLKVFEVTVSDTGVLTVTKVQGT